MYLVHIFYRNAHIPKYRAEYPAIGHDRRYDNLEIEGAMGLFTNTDAIGADWQFVAEEVFIYHTTSFWRDPKSKMIAGLSAIVLGLAATPKTLYQLGKPTKYSLLGPIGRSIDLYNNISEIRDGYLKSNKSKKGTMVTNNPDIHKH